MSIFIYKAGAEGRVNSRKADVTKPQLNGVDVNYSDGSNPLVLSHIVGVNFMGDKSASDVYLSSSTINRKSTQTKNTDTINSGYPQQNSFGVEDTSQFLLSADPKKLKISIY